MAELFTRSQCSCCQQEVAGLGVECADCPNTFRLCTECFSLGAEIGQHKTDHKYRFFDSGNLVIFPSEANWSAREEIRLLDAIEQYGFGNWQDISKHIESKSPSEAKEEYVKRFVEGTTGQITWNNLKEKVQRPVDHTVVDDGPLSPTLTQQLAPLDIQPDEMAQLGYMPNRDDYEKEFDNDAEKLVSQLVFSTEDEDIDIALKLALVDMYSRRLRERVRRKRVIRDYQLVSQFFKKDRPSQKRQFAAYERDLQEQFKSFAQFHSAREHEHFIQNLIKEKELKFRQGGSCSYKIPAQFWQVIRWLSLNLQPRPHQFLNPRKDKLRQSNPPNLAMNSLPVPTTKVLPTLLATPTLTGVKRSGDEECYPDRKRIARRFSCEDSSSNCGELLSEALSLPITGPLPKIQALACEGDQNSSQLPTDEKPKDTEDQFTANMNSLPSAQLLSSPEKHLCLSTNLLPSQYLTIKAALLVSQAPTKCMLGRPANLTDTEWSQIVNFMVQSGWMVASRVSSSEAE
ncbi:unnamed protein product [Allacma fusca]|uniref:Transcriptional adapter n=1 Tax=Allacma fusca TaxID=39272 RepID=A0A8J2L6Q6_9HEXA|nr:unnamed protein product [Allacma fusca]